MNQVNRSTKLSTEPQSTLSPIFNQKIKNYIQEDDTQSIIKISGCGNLQNERAKHGTNCRASSKLSIVRSKSKQWQENWFKRERMAKLYASANKLSNSPEQFDLSRLADLTEKR